MSENELEQILNDIKNRKSTTEPNDFDGFSNKNSDIDIAPPMTKGDYNNNLETIFDNNNNTLANSLDLESFSKTSKHDNDDYQNDKVDKKKSRPDKNKIIIICVAVVVAVAIVIGIVCTVAGNKNKNNNDESSITKAPVVNQKVDDKVLNPLTGEAGFSESALSTRPVAVVVENEYSTEAVRPQWGLSDADIVLEGESEFSTRLLLFWADYTKVPEMVGPTRSARPPFIKFSQLFDSVFIHAGLSSSKGDYIGADTVFESTNIDHINLLRLVEDGKYFGRNNDRYTAVEHTGYLNGKNLPELLKEKSISMDLNKEKFSNLCFNKTAKALSENIANSCEFVWSSTGISACPKHAKFSYDENNHKYTTTDFDSSYGTSNVSFENLIFLFDETDYVVKENYKGSGNSEIYCNYRLSGGKGTILSEGTSIEITWGVENGKLWIKTSAGKDAKLNPGKSYIGYGSSNHGGSLTLNTSAE